MRGHKSAEGEAGKRQRLPSTRRRGVLHHRQQVLKLAPAFVVAAGAAAHTAKVKAYRRPSAMHKCPRQRLHYLVVHGAGKQGMRVRNDRHAARVAGGKVQRDFKRTGRPMDDGFLGL